MYHLYIWRQKASTINIGIGVRGGISTSLWLNSELLVFNKVPQRWILTLTLFNIFTNNLHDGIEGILIECANHGMLGGEADITEGRVTMNQTQRVEMFGQQELLKV